MVDRVDSKECCLCGNCKLVCPTQAITFSKKENNFFYPNIDFEKCIECNKCEKVCPVLKPVEQQELLKSYAIKNREVDELKKSSSGGVFVALAQSVLAENGIVYGAAFCADFEVRHVAISNEKELHRLQGSKYVQSKLGDVFEEIKQYLRQGKTVLFSGSPCQTAGLKSYLGEEKTNGILYSVDFICHGILSENLFQEYIKYLENKRKSKIISFCFRDKTYGWVDSGPRIEYENGKSDHWPLYEDLYMQGYFQGLCMRESCYTCAFKNYRSGSDLTMGDFWGAEQLMPDFYDKNGVSLLCIQTRRGEELFNKAKEKFTIREEDIDILAKYNQGLFYPFNKGSKSALFNELAQKDGYMKALEETCKLSIMEKIKRFYRRLKRKLHI